ncbi:hypothetical protein ACFX14_035957 [Malus domestica]
MICESMKPQRHSMLEWCPGKTIWLAQNDLAVTATRICIHLALRRSHSGNQEENFVCRRPGSRLCLVVEIGICIHLGIPGPIGRSPVHSKSARGEESFVGQSAGGQPCV